MPILNIVPTFAKGAQTKTVDAKGGTLVVKTPSGATFTLAILPNALFQPTKITMTPLAKVGGLPFAGGLVGAVKLAPEGLRFVLPAALTITPPTPVALKVQTAFAATGSGGSFHIYPPNPTRTKLVLPIAHFSVYGEGRATEQEQAREGQRQQADAQSRQERDVGDILTEARDSGTSFNDPALQDALAHAFLPRMQRVAALMDKAITDDNTFVQALREGLMLGKDFNLLGAQNEVGEFNPPFIAKDKATNDAMRAASRLMEKRWPYILPNAYKRATAKCKSAYQPGQAQRMLVIAKWENLFGASVSLEDVETEMRSCLSFELDLDTGFDEPSGPSRAEAATHVKALKLYWGGLSQPNTLTWTGKATSVQYSSFSFSPLGSCSYTWSGRGKALVPNMQIEPAVLDDDLKITTPARMKSLTLDLDGVREVVTLTCPPASPVTIDFHTIADGWSFAHAAELGPLGYVSSAWPKAQGQLFGRKTYSGPFGAKGFTWSETTTLDVFHRPS